MKKIILMFTLISNLAFAGGEAGNGGTLQVCFSNVAIRNQVVNKLISNQSVPSAVSVDPIGDVLDHITSVRLYDLLLQEMKPGAHIIQSSASSEIILKERLDLIFSKANLDFFLDHALNATQNPDARFYASSGILALSDAGNSITPPAACALIRAVTQLVEDGVLKLFFDSRLLAKMSEVDKAALELHEAIIRLQNTTYWTDSIYLVQAFVGLVFDESFKNLKKEQFVLRLNQLNMTGDRDLKATDSFSLNGVVIDVLSKPYQPLSTVMGPFSIGLTRPTPAELNFARMDFIYTSKISASPILDDRPFDKKSSYYFIGGDQKSHSVNGMTFKHVAVSFENNNEIRLLGGALASNDPLYDQFTAVGLDESGVPVRFMVNSHGQDFEIQGNKFSSLDNVTVDSQGRLLVSTPGAFLVFTKFEHKRGKVDCSWIQYETASGKPQVCWVVVNHPFYRSIKVDSSRQIRSAFLKSETKIQGKICASEQWIEFDDKEKLINCKKP